MNSFSTLSNLWLGWIPGFKPTYGHIQANLADIDKYLHRILNAIEWAQLDQMLLTKQLLLWTWRSVYGLVFA